MLNKFQSQVFRLVTEFSNLEQPVVIAFNGLNLIDPADITMLAERGLIKVQKTEITYWVDGEGMTIWREKVRLAQIADLERRIAELKAQKD